MEKTNKTSSDEGSDPEIGGGRDETANMLKQQGSA